MTDKDYSQTAFLKFLRQGAVTGITSPATARSRKLAAEHLLIQLKSHERLDLRLLDVDELCSRFHKLQGSTIRPENIQVYKERLYSALKDFIAWTSDPAGFQSVEGEKPEAVFVAARDNRPRWNPGSCRARGHQFLDGPGGQLMTGFTIFAIGIAILALVTMFNTARIVPQKQAFIVERLGYWPR